MEFKGYQETAAQMLGQHGHDKLKYIGSKHGHAVAPATVSSHARPVKEDKIF